MNNLKISNAKLKKSVNEIFLLIARWLVLGIMGFIVIYPLIYMITASIKTSAAFFDAQHQWLPIETTFKNFKTAANILELGVSLPQTFILQVVSAIIEVFVCAFVAYGFARFKFKGNAIATFFLMISMIIPVQMYSLPLAMNYRALGIFNTSFSYWLPAILGVGIRSGMIIFIYRQFFIGLPAELEDAAYIDGAGPIKTFFKVALPSSGVVIVTNTVLSIIWYWNEFFMAQLCFISEKRPLSVMIGNFSTLMANNNIGGSNPIAPAVVSSACLIFICIPLIFYMIIQKKFVRSIDRVGITG